MPISFSGIDPAQATALTSLAYRQQQTQVPQFAYQRALVDAAKQQAMTALALNREKILNQRNLETGINKTNLATAGLQRTGLEAINKYKMGLGNYMNMTGNVNSINQQFLEMRLRNAFGGYTGQQAASQRDIGQANQAIANFGSAASGLYQANQQRRYAQEMLSYLNQDSGQSNGYPTWQYGKTSL